MEQSIDERVAQLRAATQKLRRSEYFPAIVGGIAGAIMAGIVIGMMASRRSPSAPSAETNTPESTRRSAYTLRDVIDLLTILGKLSSLMKEWNQDRRR